MNADTHIAAAAPDLFWRYEPPANRGAKVLLLTRGCTAVVGTWTGAYGEQFIAWCPLPKRDKKREKEVLC
jgi:hypothetical protein